MGTLLRPNPRPASCGPYIDTGAGPGSSTLRSGAPGGLFGDGRWARPSMIAVSPTLDSGTCGLAIVTTGLPRTGSSSGLPVVTGRRTNVAVMNPAMNDRMAII